MEKKGTVMVAMSGGVDSSVTAALLKEQGWAVRGVSLRVFDPGTCQEGDERTCCSARDIRDARRVAAALDIPFSSWDVRDAFEEEVIRPFVDSYRRGRTPNPCVLCNSKIKFSLLLRKAREGGADVLATGHYARIGRENGACTLEKGVDSEKDQSYFLFAIGAPVLPEVIFPLGGMTKDEVRRRARALGVETAAKRESQEICFIPGNDYGAFLRERIPAEEILPGEIRDGRGRRLGSHRGLIHYTVGQRRGLGLSGGTPLYVTRLDRERNTLVVGGRAELEAGACVVKDVTWFRPIGGGSLRAEVKIRSRHRQAPATLRPLGPASCQVEFDEPQSAVTPGQAAVFYRGSTVVGGGWIEEARDE